MGPRARYMIENPFAPTEEPLVIRDIGPWDKYMTVTNAAETVVGELVDRGALPPGRRLFYYDSEGQQDELVVKDGRFAGYAPGPRKEEKA